MQKGLITRYIIFQILKSLRYEKINYDFVFAKNIKNIELNSNPNRASISLNVGNPRIRELSRELQRLVNVELRRNNINYNFP